MVVMRAVEKEDGEEFTLKASSNITSKGGNNLSLKVLYISIGSPSGPAVFPLCMHMTALYSSSSSNGLSKVSIFS